MPTPVAFEKICEKVTLRCCIPAENKRGEYGIAGSWGRASAPMRCPVVFALSPLHRDTLPTAPANSAPDSSAGRLPSQTTKKEGIDHVASNSCPELEFYLFLRPMFPGDGQS
jgi:hypothetical protein